MSYHEPLSGCAIAISTSESPDMQLFGLTDEHLRDAMAEIARHLLAFGARLVYGGDLRAHGFSELLFELAARYRRNVGGKNVRPSAVNYLAWPIHIRIPAPDLAALSADLLGTAELIYLGLDGQRIDPRRRRRLKQREATDAEWARGLSAMRRVMRRQTRARILLGGRIDQFKGTMPGIAEEALLSLKASQPIFLVGGFGGCARDIAETLRLVEPSPSISRAWIGRDQFEVFQPSDINGRNGLTAEDNSTLARTVHIDQAIILILKGLLSIIGSEPRNP